MRWKWVIGLRQIFRVLSSTMPKMKSIFWSRESTLSGNRAQWVEFGKQQTKKLSRSDSTICFIFSGYLGYLFLDFAPFILICNPLSPDNLNFRENHCCWGRFGRNIPGLSRNWPTCALQLCIIPKHLEGISLGKLPRPYVRFNISGPCLDNKYFLGIVRERGS